MSAEIYTPEPIAGEFTGKDILSIKQFTPEDVEILFEEAEGMKKLLGQPEMHNRQSDILKGAMVDLFFYQPSTRTVLSFEKAAKKLGADTTKTTEVQYSSVAKGEVLEDTIRTLEATYADLIVLRHHKVGSAALAASKVEVPVINGGDGTGEHPTQALLDLFTIKEEQGHLDNLSVALIGDLKYGRTVHSLARLLAMFGANLTYVSPPQLRMPRGIVSELAAQGIKQTEATDLVEVLRNPKINVAYDTRVQKEHFEGLWGKFQYKRVKDAYVFTPEVMEIAAENLILMHPFPRVNEISHAVDNDPRAAYFREIAEGVHVRMALEAKVLGATILPRVADLTAVESRHE